MTLVSHVEGAKEFTAVEDISPLTEIASSQPLVLDILLFSWVNPASVSEDKSALSSNIDKTIQVLVASFKGTDGVTLLDFLGQLLRRLEPEVSWISHKPLGALADNYLVHTNKSQLDEDCHNFHTQPCDKQTYSSRTGGIHESRSGFTPSVPDRSSAITLF